MKDKEFQSVLTELIKECKEVLRGKGHDYTGGDSDRLINFKRNADNLGLSSMHVWAVYAGKHWDSICTLVKTGRQESGEPVKGRFLDLINYMILGYALYQDTLSDAQNCPVLNDHPPGKPYPPGHSCDCCTACGGGTKEVYCRNDHKNIAFCVDCGKEQ